MNAKTKRMTPRRSKARKPIGPSDLTLWGTLVEDLRPAPTPNLIMTDFQSRPVRMILINGEPWWVLADVARVLGYGSAKDAARLLKEKHKGRRISPTPSGDQEMIIVSEAGLYRLMMRSNHPQADAFEDWVLEEVLPSIRKTGTYRSKSGRLDRLTRKLRSKDPDLLNVRVDQVEVNKQARRQMLDDGHSVNDVVGWYNAGHEAQFGMDTAGLRSALGLKGHETPLDHFGMLPLSQSRHAKAFTLTLIEERARELGHTLTADEKRDLLRETAQRIRDSDLEKLGPNYGYGVVDDGKRGPIIDVVRRPVISAN
jgi:prophage antirepressor-like protein